MKHICILPWIAIDRNRTVTNDAPEVSLTPCCLYEPKGIHTDIGEYWNSDEIIDLRQQMLDGGKPTGCRLCWENEDRGVQSLRQSVNTERLEEYKQRLTSTKLDHKPSQVKYTAGIACNLACRMCLPNFSSKVQKVWEILNKENKMQLDNLLNTSDYIWTNRKHVDFIDITGGEPFFNKNVKKLLQDLIESKDSQHITIHLVTNATRIDLDTIALLKKYKDVVLSISMDGIEDVHEYIRPGCDWDKVTHSIRLLQKHDISLQVVSTISVLNIIHLVKLEEWCAKNNITFANPTMVDNPAELSPHNLPAELHQLVPTKYKQYLDKEMTDDPINYIRELDTYWKTDITKVMPEWRKIFDDVYWQNNQSMKQMYNTAKRYVG